MFSLRVLALASIGGLSLPAATLDGDSRVFPRDAESPRSVFVVTFTKAAGKQGSSWTQRLRDAGPQLGAPVFQVSVIEDVPKAFRTSVVSAMARQVPQPLHDRFWIVVADGESWKQCVEMTSPKEAHVVVIDGRDRIVWRGHGEPTHAMLEEIRALPSP